jgi:(heptosyl)LPS beta-1,4-glucosyltransferase
MDKTTNKSKRSTLSVVAICRNEQRDLPGFLEHLLPWVDEIVLVDDGSTDTTEVIANKACEKVKFIRHPRTQADGFAGQRNCGIAASTCDWILNMDIDERPTPALKAEILHAISATPLNAFRYRRSNYFLHRPMRAGGWNSWNNPQLARREHHSYQGKVHERCVVVGTPESIGQLNEYMLHLNDEDYAERLRKSMQYCRLEADRIIASGRIVSAGRLLISPFFEFAKKYFLQRGFRDGVPGLISAMHAACATFRALALVWDAQNRIPREQLESEIRTLWKGDNKDA